MKTGTEITILASGEQGVVEEMRKYIGLPLLVRLANGLPRWLGFNDVTTKMSPLCEKHGTPFISPGLCAFCDEDARTQFVSPPKGSR